jgi:hypothetical protein
MDAGTTYSETLGQLNDTLVRMTSPEWDALMHRASGEERRRALKEMLRIQQARLVLGNAELQGISEKLKANEEDLKAGTKALKGELEKLDNAVKVLDTVTGFVDIVARVVPLF